MREKTTKLTGRGSQRRHAASLWSAAMAVLAVVAVTVWQGVGMTEGNATASEQTIVSAADAHTSATRGELLIVDIRRPQEWRETGIAENASPITMHQEPEQFFSALVAATGGDKSKPIGIICATGGRTGYLRPHLLAAGYTNVVDVSEGMMGSQRGAGWLRSGLPTRQPTADELQ